MIHVAIEHEAKNILGSLKKYFLDEDTEKDNLEDALVSIKEINKIMNRMPENAIPTFITIELDLIYSDGRTIQRPLKVLFMKVLNNIKENLNFLEGKQVLKAQLSLL